MYPYTAVNLQESKVNTIRDYLSIVDVYGLSHMIMLTNTEKNSYMRFAKMPRGPTLTFKVDDYVLAADIFENITNNLNDEISEKKKMRISPKPLTKSFNHVPLVIMNGFNSPQISQEYTEPIKIAAMMFQSFFPPINLNDIQLKKCKRVVLFNLKFNDEGIPIVEFRHYDIDIEKHSIKKTISNILNNKKMDLSRFTNISDYILKQSGYTSGSDNEDPDLGIVEAINDEVMREDLDNDNSEEDPDNTKDNNTKDKSSKKKKININAPVDNSKTEEEKVRIKLHEIGPRLNLKIHRIEEGFLKGNVLFHSDLNKSKKDVKEMMETLKEKKKIKRERKAEQQKNVEKKKEEMPEEEKEKERIKEGKKEKMLNKKRKLEREKKKQEADYKIMSKSSLKNLKNLQKGRKK